MFNTTLFGKLATKSNRVDTT